MTRILVVDDEPHICALVSRALQAEGHEIDVVEEGVLALERMRRDDLDLVILDVGLPDLNGLEVLRTARAEGVTIPVIILTARSGTRDTVDGLDAGANDYVSKPFVIAELLARVRSRLRESAASTAVLTRGDVTLDILARRAMIGPREVDLSAREFALAEQFLRHAGEVLTRETLLSRVWGLEFDPGSNVVDVYVRYLRAKFGAARITTVRGAGYRWE